MNAGPAKPELLNDPFFQTWSGGQPNLWTHQSTTNTTYTQLQPSDPKGSPRRTVFPKDIGKSDANYIYQGQKFGFRATIASGASARDWILRQNIASSAGKTVVPTQHCAVVVGARCSVADNLLGLRVIALVSTTDTYYLVPSGGTYFKGNVGFEWSGTATTISLGLKDRWTRHGIEIPNFPLDATSVSIEITNASSGAQVIDLGEVSLRENQDLLGGAG